MNYRVDLWVYLELFVLDVNIIKFVYLFEISIKGFRKRGRKI